MIPVPRGWLAKRDGDGRLRMSPPDKGGRVLYIERMRPRRSIQDVVDQYLSIAEVQQASAPRLFETAEGEYAVAVSASIRGSKGVTNWELAFVLVDDFYAVVDARVTDPARTDFFREMVEKLARADVHGLGQRRRWYLYDPPPGWHGIYEPVQTTWSAPDQQPAAITVWHAVPKSSGASVETFFERILGQDAAGAYTLLGSSTESEVQSRHGLTGSLIRVRGHFPGLPITERALAVFEDPSYVYGLKLEGRDELSSEHLACFVRLLGSIRPLPAGDPSHTDAFSHWV